ncbi:MAG: peptide deformylase [Saprospiraceae bacterium]|nr:peptide deformylase [Saprospiraceae bacterium]
MILNKILPLGDNKLYETSHPVLKEELASLKTTIEDLHDIILAFRAKYNAGRAVASPQIGVMKRIICWNIDEPITMINPELSDLSEEMMEVWDDCMCFPNLLVKVKRHKSCTLRFFNEAWNLQTWHLVGDQSELIQHEYDHLNGILATQRAIDNKSFCWR